MTDAEIDALPAGPEMDRAVAEVLGDLKLWQSENPRLTPREWIPTPYSWHTGVAIEALERFVAAMPHPFRSWHIDYLSGRKGHEYAVYIIGEEKPDGPMRMGVEGEADTLALAACKCLLRAYYTQNK